VSHLDVISNASTASQEAKSPLSIPLLQLSHTFPTGKSVTLQVLCVFSDQTRMRTS
jgi:hypothetical protein